MVKAVKELESGLSTEVVARDYGVMRATLYKTRSRNTAAWCKPGQEIEGTI